MTGRETHGRVSFGIQHKEALRDLVGSLFLMMLGAVAAHLALAPTAHPVRIHGQEPAQEVTAGALP